MTTTVRVLIEGNKACEVRVEGDGSESNTGHVPEIIKPGTFTTKLIHGEQYVTVKETGDFLN